MYKQEELNKITTALETIKEVCEDQGGKCVDCPLRSSDYSCALADNDKYPKDWDIYDPNNPPEIKLIVE